MKKLFLASAVFLGSFSLYSCGGNSETTSAEQEGTVIDRDTTVSELEVETTVVDTTTQTQTLETDTTQTQQQ